MIPIFGIFKNVNCHSNSPCVTYLGFCSYKTIRFCFEIIPNTFKICEIACGATLNVGTSSACLWHESPIMLPGPRLRRISVFHFVIYLSHQINRCQTYGITTNRFLHLE